MKIKIVFSVYDNVDHHAYTTQKFKIDIVLLSHGETWFCDLLFATIKFLKNPQNRDG